MSPFVAFNTFCKKRTVRKYILFINNNFLPPSMTESLIQVTKTKNNVCVTKIKIK